MIEKLPRFRTSDGREFDDRAAAAEHYDKLCLIEACNRIWHNKTVAEEQADLLANSKREDLKALIAELENYA